MPPDMKSKAGSMKYAGHLQSVWETPSAADEASQWNHSVAGLIADFKATFQSSLHAAIALETIAPLTAIDTGTTEPRVTERINNQQ
jgi:hypothetical protein